MIYEIFFNWLYITSKAKNRVSLTGQSVSGVNIFSSATSTLFQVKANLSWSILLTPPPRKSVLQPQSLFVESTLHAPWAIQMQIANRLRWTGFRYATKYATEVCYLNMPNTFCRFDAKFGWNTFPLSGAITKWYSRCHLVQLLVFSVFFFHFFLVFLFFSLLEVGTLSRYNQGIWNMKMKLS